MEQHIPLLSRDSGSPREVVPWKALMAPYYYSASPGRRAILLVRNDGRWPTRLPNVVVGSATSCATVICCSPRGIPEIRGFQYKAAYRFVHQTPSKDQKRIITTSDNDRRYRKFALNSSPPHALRGGFSLVDRLGHPWPRRVVASVG
jgi:hypothetical protein